MAFVDGKHEGSSVTRALARSKYKNASAESEHGKKAGHKEVTVQETDGGGYRTISKGHDGKEVHADHQNMEQVTEHMHSHFGHAKPEKEAGPEMEQPPMEASGMGGGLEAMGVGE